MHHTKRLISLIQGSELIKSPGVFDSLSAVLVERAGFEVAFISGAGISFSRLGRPDVGLTTASEVADIIAAVRDRSDLPLIVDMDTGFGAILNVGRTVRVFERAGASALQIEDQVFPKRCGHMTGKQVIPAEEMVAKIKAAVDSRRHSTLIFARSDALAIENFDQVLARAHHYIEAGADGLLIEGFETLEQMKAIGVTFGDSVPLIHNLVEGGISPLHGSAEVELLNYKIALYPLALLHAFVPSAEAVLRHILIEGHTDMPDRVLANLDYMNALLGTGGIDRKS
mgnify:CR=1 FL=1